MAIHYPADCFLPTSKALPLPASSGWALRVVVWPQDASSAKVGCPNFLEIQEHHPGQLRRPEGQEEESLHSSRCTSFPCEAENRQNLDHATGNAVSWAAAGIPRAAVVVGSDQDRLEVVAAARDGTAVAGSMAESPLAVTFGSEMHPLHHTQ
jgi:hypothetical protein